MIKFFPVLAAAFLISTSLALSLELGREFSGLYELSNVIQLDDEAELQLDLQLFNHMDIAIFDVVLTVEDPASGGSYGSLHAPAMEAASSIFLGEFLTVPQEELERWQSGGTPTIRIQFRDSAGEEGWGHVELLAETMTDEE